MKYLGLLALVAVIGLVGCNRGNPGGPGAENKNKGTNTNNPNTNVSDNDKFTLDPPNTATTIKQGESIQIAIGIKRGSAFDQDVALSFENLPKGVSAEPKSVNVAKGEKVGKINIKADETAPPGTYTIRAVGHPQTGADATNDVKITIDKK